MKKISCFLIFICFSFCTIAQNFQATDKGYFTFIGSDRYVKLDSAFNVVWSKKINSPFFYIPSFRLTLDRGVIVAASVIGNSTPGFEKNRGVYFKVNKNGDTAFMRKLDSLDFSVCPPQSDNSSNIWDIIQTKDSGYLILAVVNLQVLGALTPMCSNIIKLDKYGNLVWSKVFNLIRPINQRVVESDDNSIYITGSFSTSIPSPAVSYIVRLDMNGNLIWSKKISQAYNVFLYPNKFGLMITFDRTLSINGLVQLDTNGQIKWQKYSNDRFSGPLFLNDGSGINSIYSITNPNTKTNLVKFDSSGNIIWSKSINHFGGLYPSNIQKGYWSIAFDFAQNKHLVLKLDSNLNAPNCISPYTVNLLNDSIQVVNFNIGLTTATIFKHTYCNAFTLSNLPINPTTNFTCVPTGIENSSSLLNSIFQVSPSPTNGEVHLVNTEKLGFVFELYDIIGNKVSSHASYDYSLELNLKHLGSGIYFYKARSNNGNAFTGKLIIRD